MQDKFRQKKMLQKAANDQAYKEWHNATVNLYRESEKSSLDTSKYPLINQLVINNAKYIQQLANITNALNNKSIKDCKHHAFNAVSNVDLDDLQNAFDNDNKKIIEQYYTQQISAINTKIVGAELMTRIDNLDTAIQLESTMTEQMVNLFHQSKYQQFHQACKNFVTKITQQGSIVEIYEVANFMINTCAPALRSATTEAEFSDLAGRYTSEINQVAAIFDLKVAAMLDLNFKLTPDMQRDGLKDLNDIDDQSTDQKIVEAIGQNI